MPLRHHIGAVLVRAPDLHVQLVVADIGDDLDGVVPVVAELEVQGGVVHRGVQPQRQVGDGKSVAGPVDDLQIGVHRAVVQGRGSLAGAAALHLHGLATLVAGGHLIAVGHRGVPDGAQIGEHIPGHENGVVAELGGAVHVEVTGGHAVQRADAVHQQILIEQVLAAGEIRGGDHQRDLHLIAGLGVVQQGLRRCIVHRETGLGRGDRAVRLPLGVPGGAVDQIIDSDGVGLLHRDGHQLHLQLPLAGDEGGLHLRQQGIAVHLAALGADGHGGHGGGLIHHGGGLDRSHVAGLHHLLDQPLDLLPARVGEGAGRQGHLCRLPGAQPQQAQPQEALPVLIGQALLHRGLGVGLQQGAVHLRRAAGIADGQHPLQQVAIHIVLYPGGSLLAGEAAQLQPVAALGIHSHRAGEQAAVAAHPAAQAAVHRRQYDHQRRHHDEGDGQAG